jgi:hypothetical protein
MASVTFPTAVGGDGSTVSDDANPTTGLDNGGHRTRFIPALKNIVAIANYVVAQVATAVAAAASAINAPGTSGQSTTSMVIEAAAKTFIIQTGKAFVVGQTVVIASTASPGNQMTGIITGYNPTTGAMSVTTTTFIGSGTFASWNVALSAVAGIQVSRRINTAGIIYGAGDLSADINLRVQPTTGVDINAGIDNAYAMTIKSVYDALALVNTGDMATITPDLSASTNIYIPIAGNRTIANPSNPIAGKSGRFMFVQDSTGGRTISWGSSYKFASGIPPVASTAPGAADIFYYDVINPSYILISPVKAVA